MKTTYDFIDENKRRTVLIVLLFPLLFAVLAYITILLVTPFVINAESADGALYQAGTVAYANYFSMYIIPAAVALVIVWIVISYFVGGNMILSSAGAVEITRDSNPEIYELTDAVAIAAGLPTPKIYLMNDSSLNAFATGRDPQHAAIALTSGIIAKLNRQELETVIAHEMAHIGNRDIRLMLVVVSGIAFFTFAGLFLLRFGGLRGGRGRRGKGAFLIFAAAVVCLIYGYMVAPLIRLALSRRREYQADATSALLTRNPAALASALEKISGDSVVESLSDHEPVAAMCIENPLKKRGLFSFLSGMSATHPPTQDRIRVLREMDGRI
ncbi:MAG: M48 family metallopeptidase [Elusimicrobium sp.]|jgi:heat shock protein HtpX|nr:M48 family metallopeptidase [Elusimicrobium sp.]